MWTDVVELRDFYATSLGQMAGRLIRQRIRELWPDVRGMRLAGFGYATPYLRGFRNEAERVIALMPASQGVLHWPADGPNAAALADEADLPLPDNSIDRVLLVHAVESSEQLRLMLREVWRVLPGNGRLIAVVPNRRGIWARLDYTPFGLGHPFTPYQLSRLLRESMFMPLRTSSALFVPPSTWRMTLAAAPAWERIGRSWFQTFAGVLLIEAQKEIYAAGAVRAKARRIFAPAPPSPVAAGGSAGLS